uniref:Olfactory receptor n=1 Tax=Sphenodon punctatus TaxID=8508 RepID=A0A8D0FZI0_SPHPU
LIPCNKENEARMNGKNQSSSSGFILLGLSVRPELWVPLSSLLLVMYLVTLLGNLLIILLIRSDAHLLHAPMYFFLSHLSLTDVCFTSTTIPKMLQNMMTQTKSISHGGCVAQMFFYMAFGNTDNLLLAAMAYDRYVAICRPLHYTVLMSPKRCVLLAGSCWLLAFLHSLLYALLVSRLFFCASREIPHFFCDLYPMMRLSCSDLTLLETVSVTEGMTEVLTPFALIVVSYILIFCAIMKVPSATGKRKAFSTCGSHLTIVVLFYAIIGVYFQPAAQYSAQQGMVFAIMYTVITPMANPYIYSLRNKDVQGALRRLWGRKVLSQRG